MQQQKPTCVTCARRQTSVVFVGGGDVENNPGLLLRETNADVSVENARRCHTDGGGVKAARATMQESM